MFLPRSCCLGCDSGSTRGTANCVSKSLCMCFITRYCCVHSYDLSNVYFNFIPPPYLCNHNHCDWGGTIDSLNDLSWSVAVYWRHYALYQLWVRVQCCDYYSHSHQSPPCAWKCKVRTLLISNIQNSMKTTTYQETSGHGYVYHSCAYRWIGARLYGEMNRAICLGKMRGNQLCPHKI